jgi:predicted ATP-dependent serine protease
MEGFILPSLPLTNKKTLTENMSIRKKSTIHAEFSQESSFVTQAKVMTAPRDAPQTFLYKADTIYVRECYHTYYDKIIDELLGKLDYYFISVTGTPGIGKSIFYLYFIKRYLSENHIQIYLSETGRAKLSCH